MKPVTIQVPIRVDRRNSRRRTAEARRETSPGRIPRVAKLLALAHRLEGLVAGGEVAGYADLARLGGVTRARLTQIMALTRLAPDLQEQILFLPLVIQGRDSLTERDLRPITAEVNWKKQRKMWDAMIVA